MREIDPNPGQATQLSLETLAEEGWLHDLRYEFVKTGRNYGLREDVVLYAGMVQRYIPNTTWPLVNEWADIKRIRLYAGSLHFELD